MQTTVVNKRTWRAGNGGPWIYIGRGNGGRGDMTNTPLGFNGWLGNPVHIGQRCPVCQDIHVSGGSTLDCYRVLLDRKRQNTPGFDDRLHELKGFQLVCFCAPKPCHGDVLAQLIDSL